MILKTIKSWFEVVVMLFMLASAVIIPIYGAFALAEWLFK